MGGEEFAAKEDQKQASNESWGDEEWAERSLQGRLQANKLEEMERWGVGGEELAAKEDQRQASNERGGDEEWAERSLQGRHQAESEQGEMER